VAAEGDEQVVIGVLARPHGVSGELGARPTGPTLAQLPAGAGLVARARDGGRRLLRLAERRGHPDGPILRFEGVSTREQAAALTGLELLVEADALPALGPDTHYVRDLIGCRVSAGGRPLGDVVDVHAGPANDALEVAGPHGSLLVPFTADAVIALDVRARRLELRSDLLPASPEA
jgi:16S rRNA processing protein RimM